MSMKKKRIYCHECENEDKFTVWQESAQIQCGECGNVFDYTEEVAGLLAFCIALPALKKAVLKYQKVE